MTTLQMRYLSLGALSILDAANCIRLAHLDWWLPTCIAAFCAYRLRPEMYGR